MWTAILIVLVNGQQVELRGAQSMSEAACMRAALTWSWGVLTQEPKLVLVDVRCVLTPATAPSVR